MGGIHIVYRELAKKLALAGFTARQGKAFKTIEEATIIIRPDLGPLTDDITATREAGLSVTDTAAIFGISRGRISQLANTNRERVA